MDTFLIGFIAVDNMLTRQYYWHCSRFLADPWSYENKSKCECIAEC